MTNENEKMLQEILKDVAQREPYVPKKAKLFNKELLFSTVWLISQSVLIFYFFQ